MIQQLWLSEPFLWSLRCLKHLIFPSVSYSALVTRSKATWLKERALHMEKTWTGKAGAEAPETRFSHVVEPDGLSFSLPLPQQDPGLVEPESGEEAVWILE